LTGGSDVLLQRELTSDSELKGIVEKYAQDQKAFHDAFGQAFIKLTNLGQDADSLVNVENLLEAHPYKKFIDVYY
jgi:catalase (peroxidase I)